MLNKKEKHSLQYHNYTKLYFKIKYYIIKYYIIKYYIIKYYIIKYYIIKYYIIKYYIILQIYVGFGSILKLDPNASHSSIEEGFI